MCVHSFHFLDVAPHTNIAQVTSYQWCVCMQHDVYGTYIFCFFIAFRLSHPIDDVWNKGRETCLRTITISGLNLHMDFKWICIRAQTNTTYLTYVSVLLPPPPPPAIPRLYTRNNARRWNISRASKWKHVRHSHNSVRATHKTICKFNACEADRHLTWIN